MFFFWGFKGQLRWPEGSPHLALNPPYSLFLFFLGGGCFFPSLLLYKNWHYCFSPRKGFFLSIVESLPLFILSLVLGLPLFQFLFLCLSLCLLFFYFFLPSCLALLLSFGSFFLSLSFLLFLLCFCFMKGTTSKHSIAFFHQCFSFWGFLSCFLRSNPFSLCLFFFPDFQLCFFVQYECFWFQNKQLKHTHTHVWSRGGGCNKSFILSTCVLQNRKSYRFFGGPFFLGGGGGKILVDVQKHYWNRYFSKLKF